MNVNTKPDLEISVQKTMRLTPEKAKNQLGLLDLPQEDRPIRPANYHRYHPFLRPLIPGKEKDSWLEVSPVTARVLQTEWQRDSKREQAIEKNLLLTNARAGTFSSIQKFSWTVSMVTQSRSVCYFENKNGQKTVCKNMTYQDHFDIQETKNGSAQFKYYNSKNAKDLEQFEISMACSTSIPELTTCQRNCWE